MAATGMPIEIPRAVCAVLASVLLSEAFVVENARTHADWEQRREEFITIVAHDLRSPIGAIKLGAQALERSLRGGAQALDVERTQAVLRHLESSALSLDRMVADLLDTSRLEAHRLSLEPQRLELVPFVTNIVDRAAAETKGHPVTIVLPASLPSVEADPARVEQVLTNLLSNAAKYSAPRSEIRVDAVARDRSVELAVTNLGRPLPATEWSKLFRRFYRDPDHKRQNGLGLGLYIAKGLVEAHGGRIWIDHPDGNSHTSIHFTLPCERSRLLDTHHERDLRD